MTSRAGPTSGPTRLAIVQTSVARPSTVSEEWRAGIRSRIAAVHALWQQGVSDLTLAQVNHFERTGVLPIAFTLMHAIVGEDRNTARYLGADAMLWDEQGWAKRVGLVGTPPVRGTPMADAERIRLGDVDACDARTSFARHGDGNAGCACGDIENVARFGACYAPHQLVSPACVLAE